MKIRAVVVGIDTYRDARIAPLSFARSDGLAIAELIESGIRPSEREVTCLFNSKATKQSIMLSIGEDLARVSRPDDVIIIYFAGHGSPETGVPPNRTARYI